MDFDLQRVKQYEMSSQLLVFGYGRDIHDAAHDLILYIILAFYQQPEYFERFNSGDYSIDDTKTIITKKKSGYSTAYGQIPMYTNNIGVHLFEIKILNMTGYPVIGIDEGRTNQDSGVKYCRIPC